MRSCNELCMYFEIKEWNIIGSKHCIITNGKPYFVVYFQTTLVSQRHSSVLVNKNCAFYDELSLGPCMCYILHNITITGLPFDQMEPPHSMQHRSGNPVRIPKLEQDFPNFWLSFTRVFMKALIGRFCYMSSTTYTDRSCADIISRCVAFISAACYPSFLYVWKPVYMYSLKRIDSWHFCHAIRRE